MKERLSSFDLLTAKFKHKNTAPSFAILSITLLLLMSTNNLVYAANLGRLATQEQLDKYCIAVRLKIDGDIHYFSFITIKSFNDEGIRIVFGRHKEKENFIAREDILNFDEALTRYKKLQEEFNRGVIR